MRSKKLLRLEKNAENAVFCVILLKFGYNRILAKSVKNSIFLGFSPGAAIFLTSPPPKFFFTDDGAVHKNFTVRNIILNRSLNLPRPIGTF